MEIVEDENGQCTVRIKPKPIKLKIINPYGTQNIGTSDIPAQGKKRKLSGEDINSTNGHFNDEIQFDPNEPASKTPRKDSHEVNTPISNDETPKVKPGRPKIPTQRDIRTHCDKVYKIA